MNEREGFFEANNGIFNNLINQLTSIHQIVIKIPQKINRLLSDQELNRNPETGS